MLNRVVFSIDVLSECEYRAMILFIKIHSGKFDSSLVGSKYTINGLMNSIFIGIKDKNANTIAVRMMEIVKIQLLLFVLFILIYPF